MKNKLAKLLNLKPSQLSVRGAKSGGFVEARIRPNKTARSIDPLVWPGEFPEELRRKALVAVYGERDWVKAPFCAGNVGRYGIVITAAQWEAVLAPDQTCEDCGKTGPDVTSGPCPYAHDDTPVNLCPECGHIRARDI